ncbi:MAG: XrtA/PEP-CTERM system TPR-repeat protein PrsT [Pseudomonadota bacterium]
MIKKAALGLLLAGLVALVGCSGGEERKAAHKQRGDELYAAEDYEKARIEYKNVLQIDPDDAEGRFLLARTLEKLQKWPNAVANYRRAIDLDPTMVEPRIGYARILVAANQVDKATAELDEIFRLDANNPDAFLVRAGVKVKQGDQADAKQDILTGLTLAPGRPDLVSMQAMLLGESGDLGQAEQVLSGGIKAHPEDMRLRELLARLFVQRGEQSRAIAEFAEVVKAKPDDLRVRLILSELLVRNQRVDEARQALEDGVSQNPDSLEAKLVLVRHLGRHDGADAAVGKLRELAEADPDDPRLQLALGRLHLGLGQIDKAEAVFVALIADPKEPPEALEARTLLARAKLSSEPERARALVAETLSRNPSDRDALLMRAQAAVRANDPAAAIVDLRTVVRDHPNLRAAVRLLAQAHLMNNEWEQARDHLQRAVDVDPDHIEAYQLLIRMLGERARTDKSVESLLASISDKALAAYDRRLITQPDDSAVRLARGRLRIARRDFEAGIGDFREVLSREPANQGALNLLARALEVSGDGNQATEVLEEAIARSPDAVSLRQQLARRLLLSNRGAEALSVVDEGVARAPDSIPLLGLKAELHRRGGQWGDVSSTADRLLSLSPEQPTGHYFKGVAMQATGRSSESVPHFKEALARSPNAIEPLTALARAYHSQGQSEAALDTLNQVLERSPTNFAAANLKGELLMSLKRFDEAEVAVTKAMELRPTWAEPYRNLSRSKVAAGDTAAAVSMLERAMTAQPTDLRAAYQLAQLYMNDGRRADAITQYRSILDRAPSQQVAANNLAMILVEGAKPSSDELDEAYELVKGFGASRQVVFRDTLAWVQLLRGEAEEALGMLRQIVAAAPDTPVYRYHLAEALIATGDKRSAEIELKRALSHDKPFEGRANAEEALRRL